MDKPTKEEIQDLYGLIRTMQDLSPDDTGDELGPELQGDKSDEEYYEYLHRQERITHKNKRQVGDKLHQQQVYIGHQEQAKKDREHGKKRIRSFYIKVANEYLDDNEIDKHYEFYKNEIEGFSGWIEMFISKTGRIPRFEDIPRKYQHHFAHSPYWIRYYVDKVNRKI